MTKEAKKFICSKCGDPKTIDEMEFGDTENEICEECHTKWQNEQIAYWKPLYEGERSAGLVGLSKEEKEEADRIRNLEHKGLN